MLSSSGKARVCVSFVYLTCTVVVRMPTQCGGLVNICSLNKFVFILVVVLPLSMNTCFILLIDFRESKFTTLYLTTFCFLKQLKKLWLGIEFMGEGYFCFLFLFYKLTSFLYLKGSVMQMPWKLE